MMCGGGGMGSDLSLRVMLQAVDSGASSIVKGLGSVLSGLSGPAGMAAKGLLAIASAAVAFTAASVAMASQYDQSMRMVQSLTGASSAQMAQYDTQLKTLAINAGVAPNQLAQGLYQVISAGYQGSQAMKVLTLATRDSKIGMTSAATTATALTKTLANFAWQTKDANQVNGIMLETVTLGQSTFSQYASQITRASTAASQFHISLQTMSAAWSTMTAKGLSATQASTDFAQVVSGMYSNIGTITKSLEKNGIAFNEAKFNTLNFRDKIVMLSQALQEAANKHVKITGVTKQMAEGIQKISQNLGTYDQNLKTLNNHQEMANKTQQAWAITQGGFAQTMSRVQAALQVLMINIGQALLPVLTKAAQAAIPIINGFTGIIGAARNVATGIGNVIGFFQKNQVAALSLLIPLGMIGAVLTQMAVSAIAGFIASLPAMIAGWATWAAGAWAAAAGTIAATWPLLAIGAAIAIVIGIIILLVTHWSAVSQWLQGAWAATVKAVQIGLQALGQFFVMIWQGIVSGLTAAWNWIVNAVKMYLSILWAIWTAPFRAIAALFTWLYSHNRYFALLVNKIREIVQAGLAWLRNAWNVAINWLAGLWHGLSTLASNAWNAVKTAVMNAVIALGLWEIAQWNKATSWLADKWNSLKDLMGKAWQAVSGLLANAWSMFVSKPLQNLWNSIVNFVNGWPKQLFQSGVNMIQGLINGILSMIGKAGQAAQSVMSKIASFLGFHSPAKEGEGRYIIQYGSNMVKGFSSGVLSAIPQLQTAVNMAVHAGMGPMTSPALAGSSVLPYGRPPSGNSYSNNSGGNNYHYGDIVIHGTPGMNTNDLANAVMKKMDVKFRRSGVMGNPAYGIRDS
jgi:TP901 family phage tail tape measure protein